MSLINRLITLNLIELGQAIPTISHDSREQILDIALDEIQATLQEADEQLINIKSKHVQDESNLVGVMKNIQDLTKADATPTRDTQLAALLEARNRLEEDLNGLEFDEKQLRQETAKLLAKVKLAETERTAWLNTTNTHEPHKAQTETEEKQPKTKSEAGFGNRRVDEPFERLEQLKRKLAAKEISTQEASNQLEQEIRNFELEKIFQNQEQEEQLEKELAELKKKLM